MSTVELAIRWSKAAVIVAVAVWELVQLARRRDDLALRVLAPGLVALAFAATVGIHTALLDPLEQWFGGAWSHMINGAWMIMAYCWAAYFLLANTTLPAARRRRRALLELGVLLAALGTAVVVREVSPPEIWHSPHPPTDYWAWQRSAWYLAMDGYSLAAWFVGVRRALVLRRHLSHSWARAAFWLVGLGSAGMALGVDGVSLLRQGVRQVNPSFDPDLLSTLYSVGQLGGQFILALGLALVPLATIAVRARAGVQRRHRARYGRRLLPLWRTLTEEFPHVALGVHTEHDGDAEYERLATEITDGLAELARDCPHPTGDMRDPHVAAGIIAAGLEQRAAQRQVQWAGDGVTPSEPPYPRLEPDFPTWRARAHWMVAVAAELRRRGVIGEDDHARASAR